MNDRTRKKDGRPRQQPVSLTPQQRAFAEHYAKHGDWVEALHHAYPTSTGWKSESKHGTIARLRANPLVRDAIDEIRRPALERSQVSYEWVLEKTRQFTERLMEHPDALAVAKEVRAYLKLSAQLVGIVPVVGNDRLPPPPKPGDVIDGDYSTLPPERLLAIARGGDTGAEAASSGEGEDLPRAFRTVRVRPGADDAPQDPVLGATGDDRGPDVPGDGVHAAGRGEVDILQRVRSVLGRRPETGGGPDRSEPHESPGAELRPPGEEHDP